MYVLHTHTTDGHFIMVYSIISNNKTAGNTDWCIQLKDDIHRSQLCI